MKLLTHFALSLMIVITFDMPIGLATSVEIIS